MISKNSMPVDSMELVKTSVQTYFGLRDIRFFWGDLGKVVERDSVVIISSNRFRNQTGEIGGKAWDSLCKKFPHLENQRDDFKEVIVSGKESHHWELDPWELEEVMKYEEFPKPSILVKRPDQQDQFQRIFAVRHSYDTPGPENKSYLKDRYDKVLKACFPAIKSVEAEVIASETRQPSLFGNIVLSSLINPVRFKEEKKTIFNSLYNAGKTWLKASPMWKSVDIVCFWKGLSYEEAKTEIENLLGREKINRESQNLQSLFQVNFDILGEAIRKLSLRTSSNEMDSQILEEMENLKIQLGPIMDKKTLNDFGNPTRKFTEALLMWFIREFFGKGVAIRQNNGRPKSMEDLKNILKDKNIPDSKGYASDWFMAYVEAIQNISNKASHTKDAGEHRFPESIQEEDLIVLLSCLKRVLDFQVCYLDR